MTPEIAELIRKVGGDPTPLKRSQCPTPDLELFFHDGQVGGALMKLAKMLGEPDPGRALFELVRHGPAVAAELLEEFRVFLRNDGYEQSRVENAVASLVRLLKAQDPRKVRLMDWPLDALPVADTRRRLVVYVSPDTDDALRSVCAVTRLSLSRAVEVALMEWLARQENRREVREGKLDGVVGVTNVPG